MTIYNVNNDLVEHSSTLTIEALWDIIENLNKELVTLLQSPSYTDMTAANKLISDAAGEPISVIRFLQHSLDETPAEMPDQFTLIKNQSDSIICHNTTAKQAAQIAVSLTTWYEDAILAHAEKEQAEEDYSIATQDLEF